MRLSDDLIEATYGSRTKYLKVCEANLRDRSCDHHGKYIRMQRHLGIPLLTEAKWRKAQAAQIKRLRANIAANQHEPF